MNEERVSTMIDYLSLRLSRFVSIAIVLIAMLQLQACSNTHATQKNKFGEEVMLLGHDPVAYFTAGKPTRGDPALKSTLPGRTYYFASAANKQSFDANPTKFEPQYGAFCSSGVSYGIKWNTDPTEWEIVDGKLYIFGDILGREAWKLDIPWSIKTGDQMWAEVKDSGWRMESLLRWTVKKVPWYKNGREIRDAWAKKHPDREWPKYDTGSFWASFTKGPGWRAREGYGPQPVLGFVGEDACPPACAGTVSQGFTASWPR
jgi:YHS domain-containing protein